MLYPPKGHIFCSPGNEGGSQALQACLVLLPLSFCGRWQSSHRAFILEQPLSSAWWIVVASSISLEAPTPKMPLLLPEPYTLLLRYVLHARKGSPSHSVSGHPHPSLQRDRTCRALYLWYLLMSWELCIADWLVEPWSCLPSPQALWTHESIPFWCFSSGGEGMKTKSGSSHLKCTQAPSLGHRWQSSWITLVWWQNV